MSQTDSNTVAERFYHGTKADPKLGGSIIVGYKWNFATAKPLLPVYSIRTLDAATLRRRTRLRLATKSASAIQPRPTVCPSRFGSPARIRIASRTCQYSFSR